MKQKKVTTLEKMQQLKYENNKCTVDIVRINIKKYRIINQIEKIKANYKSATRKTTKIA